MSQPVFGLAAQATLLLYWHSVHYTPKNIGNLLFFSIMAFVTIGPATFFLTFMSFYPTISHLDKLTKKKRIIQSFAVRRRKSLAETIKSSMLAIKNNIRSIRKTYKHILPKFGEFLFAYFFPVVSALAIASIIYRGHSTSIYLLKFLVTFTIIIISNFIARTLAVISKDPGLWFSVGLVYIIFIIIFSHNLMPQALSGAGLRSTFGQLILYKKKDFTAIYKDKGKIIGCSPVTKKLNDGSVIILGARILFLGVNNMELEFGCVRPNGKITFIKYELPRNEAFFWPSNSINSGIIQISKNSTRQSQEK